MCVILAATLLLAASAAQVSVRTKLAFRSLSGQVALSMHVFSGAELIQN